MTKQFILLLLTLTFISCHPQKKFDKNKWDEMGDLMTFPNRKSMLKDLTKNVPLIGKKYKEVIDLLGPPQFTMDSTMQMGYQIEVDYGFDIDPIYYQNLLLQFHPDSTLKLFKVKEWKK